MTFRMPDDDITHPPEQKTVGRILYGFSLLKCTVSTRFARTSSAGKLCCRNVAFRRHPMGTFLTVNTTTDKSGGIFDSFPAVTALCVTTFAGILQLLSATPTAF